MPDPRELSIVARLRGFSVHLLTASGIVFAFLAMAEVAAVEPDARLVFACLIVTTLIDAVDGPLARRWAVKTTAPEIDGRTIDDILDYLTFTFIPLMLAWRAGWLAVFPSWLDEALIVLAMGTSLLGFANTRAKDAAEGFFRGFPSYWNITVFYLGLWATLGGPAGRWLNSGVVLALAVLTVLPVRFLYPNLAPRPWKLPLLIGAAVWLAVLCWLLVDYPRAPEWLMGLSLVYPLGYVILSAVLDRRARRRRREDDPNQAYSDRRRSRQRALDGDRDERLGR